MSDAGMVLGSGEAAAIEMIEHTFGKGKPRIVGRLHPAADREMPRLHTDGR